MEIRLQFSTNFPCEKNSFRKMRVFECKETMDLHFIISLQYNNSFTNKMRNLFPQGFNSKAFRESQKLEKIFYYFSIQASI
jgi:hypothetical protein